MLVLETSHNDISTWLGLDGLHYYGLEILQTTPMKGMGWDCTMASLETGKKMGCGVPKLIMLDCSTSTRSTVKTVLWPL